ncbi:hypothetical protein JD844_017296 [Phrynosoma platyrhinos]|uniref:Band 7 domain-containing protein n=1 Tax=Phrynosoma platyrhinos TaxID=52577 RepID=A0ABQ7SLR3_PHRPL|nr:hypothetical protein JD844_017296 [Phrynosoma platyrhinos]
MKAEKKPRSSSREPHGRNREPSIPNGKKEKMDHSRKTSKERQKSGQRKGKKETKSTLEWDNQVHTSTVVDVDDVVSLEEEAEVMALLESEKMEEGVKSAGLGVCEWLLVILSLLFIMVTFPFSIWFCMKIVREYERAILFRFGRILRGRPKGPGLFFLLPCLDTYHKIDLRIKTLEIPFYEVITKDMVSLAIDTVCYYRMENATLLVTTLASLSNAVQLLVQTIAKRLLAHRSLTEILMERKGISQEIKSLMSYWLLQCFHSCSKSFFLDKKQQRLKFALKMHYDKDIQLPAEVRESLTAQAEAQRQATVRVIAAEGEKAASESLKMAAEILSHTPAAIPLRYLQLLQNLTGEKPSTFILPLPVDVLNLASVVSSKSIGCNPSSDTTNHPEVPKDKDSPML